MHLYFLEFFLNSIWLNDSLVVFFAESFGTFVTFHNTIVYCFKRAVTSTLLGIDNYFPLVEYMLRVEDPNGI